MKKIITTLILGILIYGNQYAQEEIIEDTVKVRKNALGVSFGTGFGFDYSRTLKQNKLYVTEWKSLYYVTVFGPLGQVG